MEKYIQIIIIFIFSLFLIGCNDNNKIIFLDDVTISFIENNNYLLDDDLNIKKNDEIKSKITIIDDNYYYDLIENINNDNNINILDAGVLNNLNYISYTNNNIVYYVCLINEDTKGFILESNLDYNETYKIFKKIKFVRS